jgi:hypothetical protein
VRWQAVCVCVSLAALGAGCKVARVTPARTYSQRR